MPDRKYFYSELYLKDIPDKYYSHAQKVFEELKFKNLGDYHDWYVKSDTLLLADVFKKFRKKCTETYEIDTAHSRKKTENFKFLIVCIIYKETDSATCF